MSLKKPEIGRSVIILHSSWGNGEIVEGKVGKIVFIGNIDVGIEFPFKDEGFHDSSGSGKRKQCWNFYFDNNLRDHIEYYQPKQLELF